MRRPLACLILTLLSGIFGSRTALAAPGEVESGFPRRCWSRLVICKPLAWPCSRMAEIIVAGSHDKVDGILQRNLARLNADGTLDTTFKSYVNGWVYAVAIQPDGKILVAGGFTAVISQGHPTRMLSAGGSFG